MFPDVAIVREVQQELDTVIEEGVVDIVNLLKNQVSSSEVVNIVNLLKNQVSSSGGRQHCQPPQKPGEFLRVVVNIVNLLKNQVSSSRVVNIVSLLKNQVSSSGL
jgi:hypothetical protein